MERRLNKLGLFDRPAVKKAVQLKTLCGWIMFVQNVSHHGQSFKLSSSDSECLTCDGHALVPEGSSPPRPPCRPGDNDALMTIVMWQYDGHHIPSSLHMLLKKVDSSIRASFQLVKLMNFALKILLNAVVNATQIKFSTQTKLLKNYFPVCSRIFSPKTCNRSSKTELQEWLTGMHNVRKFREGRVLAAVVILLLVIS